VHDEFLAKYEANEIKKFRESGKILKDIRERSRKLITVGASLYEIAETIESWTPKGAGIAFPVNLSINEIASHYCPAYKEERTIGENDLINVDLGIHIDGHVTDTAYCVDLSGENGKLVEAAEEAVQNAISMVRSGVNAGKVGGEIEKTIKRFGFKPVENLSGHGLGIYRVHIAPSVPNIEANGDIVEEGMVIAIEPFASTGRGMVTEDVRTDLFSLEREDLLPRSQDARNILSFIKENYKTLPFCERWLAKKFPEFKLKVGLRELVMREIIRTYPALKDKAGSLVSQAELSIVVTKDGCEVIT